MNPDKDLIKFNPYRCKALGLTQVEATCLNYVRLHNPLTARLKNTFPVVYERLERKGLIENVSGEWCLTESGRSKIRVLLEGK